MGQVCGTQAEGAPPRAPSQTTAAASPGVVPIASEEWPKAKDSRSGELAWVANLTSSLPDDVRKIIVSHRGFHSNPDTTRRPLENTVPAYDWAWSSGLITCECDVQLTRDGHLVLMHDQDMERLVMLLSGEAAIKVGPGSLKRSAPAIEKLSYKELISKPSQLGARQPLLKDILEDAAAFENARLIIELKPGDDRMPQAVVSFFEKSPKLAKCVAAIMSFDAGFLFNLAQKWPGQIARPQLLLMTRRVSTAVRGGAYEVRLDFLQGDVSGDAEKAITRGGVRLDGVYVEWHERLVRGGKDDLKKLAEKMTVGMWRNAGEPDFLGVAMALARLGVSYVNTDFPRGYMREYIGKVQQEERLPHSLFASVPANPDGSADGLWPERPTRAQMIEALRSKEFDILVIGGGATGVGTALEAMRQGYSVALVERGDFACGTSSKSSNMIHGGIRYLQAFVNNPEGATEQINVVRNGLKEQNYMYNCAPYMVRPCPFMVAVYDEKDRLVYEQLLKKYDELGADDPFPESSWQTKKDTLFRFPQLRQEGLLGAFTYFDGQQDDARMALLIALTSIEGGAAVANYMEVQSLVKEGGVTKGVVVQDLDAASSQPFEVRAKVVVNATGPFTDAIRKMDDGPEIGNIIHPAAGTHVVLPDHFSPEKAGMAILETSDGRAMFYLPWMGQTIVGTTDHVAEIKPLLEPPVEDIEWIVNEVNRYLNPDQNPATMADVRSAWVGIRPLAKGLQSATGTKDTSGGGEETKAIPREHAVIISDSKMVTITGGKWTSYRHMAQDTLKEAIAVGSLPPPKVPFKEEGPTFKQGFVGTKAGANKDWEEMTIANASVFHSDVVELRNKWRFQRDIAENLVTSYGAHAVEVAAIAKRGQKDGLSARLAYGYPWIMAQVVYAVRREYARSVPDILSRRTRLAQVDVLAASDAVAKIVDVMAEELSWDKARVDLEVKRSNEFLKTCGLKFCQDYLLDDPRNEVI